MAENTGGLLNNPLLLQYLAGAGAALSSDQPVGAALGNITMQNIAAQNQAKLLRNMLSGLPTGAKLSGDRDNISLKLPTSSLAQELAGFEAPATKTANLSPSNMASDISRNNTLGSLLNPSSSPLDNISPADLAGLTPSDITQAVSLAQTVKERQSASEIARIKAETDVYKALNKDERTVAQKNFQFAVEQGYDGSFSDFVRDAKTSHIKDFEYAKDNGYKGDFQSWLRDITALGGGLSLGEFKARKQITSLEDRKDYFSSPKGLGNDIDTFLNQKNTRNDLLIESEGDPIRMKQLEASKTEQYIDEKIQSSDAKLVDKKLEQKDGKNTFVWKLKWPDGSTSEVRRDIVVD